jgi:DNA helicase HerA-like ATPase
MGFDQSTGALGSVIAVRGSRASATIPLSSANEATRSRVTVGKFVGIQSGGSLLVSSVTDVTLKSDGDAPARISTLATLDIIGEIRGYGQPGAKFIRGVGDYPAIGDRVLLLGSDELRIIFDKSNKSVIEIGRLQLDTELKAYIDVNEMLSKHFAVLGTTGVGKSSAVALLLQQIVKARPDVHVLILDVHNEYKAPFGESALALSPRNMRLPFWMFNFEELIDVVFSGRKDYVEEIDLLADLIPQAKANYHAGPAMGASRTLAVKRPDSIGPRYSVDTPVPYRMADLVSLIDVQMGKLENRALISHYKRLIARIESVSTDPRYAFIFERANVGGDTMAERIGHMFFKSHTGVPVTIFQLAGFPSEVVDSLVSVIARLAFDLGQWSDGGKPMLLVCEEAHRYISADKALGFGPTRRAVSRIAKEGRKYGVFLGLVTQRPAELDATILSQCSTLFAMRMTNDRDQALLHAAVPDTAADLLSFLPSLSTGEVFAFGEGVALPTRIRLNRLPAEQLPKSDAAGGRVVDDALGVAAIVNRWRGFKEGGERGEAHVAPGELTMSL